MMRARLANGEFDDDPRVEGIDGTIAEVLSRLECQPAAAGDRFAAGGDETAQPAVRVRPAAPDGAPRTAAVKMFEMNFDVLRRPPD